MDKRIKDTENETVCFIDNFFVPAAGVLEFYERMQINRNFIKTLPGFLTDAVYEQRDENGNLTCLTVANWQNARVLEDAKDKVQTEYKRQGFNPAEMMQRLGITMDRGIFKQTH